MLPDYTTLTLALRWTALGALACTVSGCLFLYRDSNAGARIHPSPESTALGAIAAGDTLAPARAVRDIPPLGICLPEMETLDPAGFDKSGPEVILIQQRAAPIAAEAVQRAFVKALRRRHIDARPLADECRFAGTRHGDTEFYLRPTVLVIEKHVKPLAPRPAPRRSVSDLRSRQPPKAPVRSRPMRYQSVHGIAMEIEVYRQGGELLLESRQAGASRLNSTVADSELLATSVDRLTGDFLSGKLRQVLACTRADGAAPCGSRPSDRPATEPADDARQALRVAILPVRDRRPRVERKPPKVPRLAFVLGTVVGVGARSSGMRFGRKPSIGDLRDQVARSVRTHGPFKSMSLVGDAGWTRRSLPGIARETGHRYLLAVEVRHHYAIEYRERQSFRAIEYRGGKAYADPNPEPDIVRQSSSFEAAALRFRLYSIEGDAVRVLWQMSVARSNGSHLDSDKLTADSALIGCMDDLAAGLRELSGNLSPDAGERAPDPATPERAPDPATPERAPDPATPERAPDPATPERAPAEEHPR